MKSQNNRKIFTDQQGTVKQQQNNQQGTTKQQQNAYPQQSLNFQIPCYYHQNQFITNFCLNEKCLMPLCPICVQQHSQEHFKINETIELQHIDQVKQSCEYNLKKILEEQNKASNQLGQLKKVLEGDQQIDELLAEKKQQCYKMIEEYFTQIKYQYQRQCQQNSQKQQTQYNQQYHELNQLEQELTKYLRQINKPDKMLSAAIKLLATDYFNTTSQYLTQFQTKLKNEEQNQAYLSINEEQLLNFNSCLAQYISVINQNQPIQPQKQKYLQPQQQQFQNLNIQNPYPQDKKPSMNQSLSPCNNFSINYLILYLEQQYIPQYHDNQNPTVQNQEQQQQQQQQQNQNFPSYQSPANAMPAQFPSSQQFQQIDIPKKRTYYEPTEPRKSIPINQQFQYQTPQIQAYPAPQRPIQQNQYGGQSGDFFRPPGQMERPELRQMPYNQSFNY